MSFPRCVLLVVALLLPLPTSTVAQSAGPLRIVLTNDDGIEAVEERLLPVAQELRRFAEVFIVVPDRDRSGSAHFLSISRSVSLESRLEHAEAAGAGLQRLEVHSVAGYPADCVVLALFGILEGQPPDLVLSGPNGGPNLADGWFASGTIGAARAAAYLGVPAIAVSGIDDDEPVQVSALSRWIAAVATGPLARALPTHTFLTIAVPRVPPEEIRGVRLAPRARVIEGFDVSLVATSEDSADEDEVTSVWTVRSRAAGAPAPENSDVALHDSGYIVVTPMKADEHDYAVLEVPSRVIEALPEWPTRP